MLTVSRVLAFDEGVITYYFVGFGVTGRACARANYRGLNKQNRVLGYTILLYPQNQEPTIHNIGTYSQRAQ